VSLVLPPKPHIKIPGSKAVILTDLSGLAVGEFPIADAFRFHRMADVQCGPQVGSFCHVERKCHQCGQYNRVPVTTHNGVPVGTSGWSRCVNCAYELLMLDAVTGRVNIVDRGGSTQVTVFIPDAVRVWHEYQAHIMAQAREGAAMTRAVRATKIQHRAG